MLYIDICVYSSSIVGMLLVMALVQSWLRLEHRRVVDCLVLLLSQVIVVLKLPQDVQVGVLRHGVAQLKLLLVQVLLRVGVVELALYAWYLLKRRLVRAQQHGGVLLVELARDYVLTIFDEVLLVQPQALRRPPVDLRCRLGPCTVVDSDILGSFAVPPERCNSLIGEAVSPWDAAASRRQLLLQRLILLICSLYGVCQSMLDIDVLKLDHSVGAH